MITVLLAHAPGEEARAEELAVPLRTAGYDVWHFGDVVVGESLTEEASRVLSQNGPVVLCGTARAMGTRLPRHLLNAARSRGPQARIFPVHMDQDADLDSAVFGTQVAVYWADQVKAIDDLLAALRKYYPLSSDGGTAGAGAEPVGRGGLPLAVRSAYLSQLVQRYRRLDLEVLTPVEHETHLPVLLQSVFVPQGVRADPPPVELSKELWRRLVEAGEIDESDLPDGLDLDRLVHARDTYAQRPVQPVLDVVTAAEHRLLVLLGDPGAGKSTLARFLVLSLAGGAGEHRLSGLEGRLPILVELRLFVDLRRECPTFLDYLHRLHETDGLGLPADRLDDHLRRDGHALVVFDGLDELFDPKEREAVARQIVGFAARYPLVRIVVTSRVIGYRRSVLDDAGFTHYTIQDLDDEQVGRFADSWYQLALHDRPGEIAPRRDRLLRAIHGSASIRELAGNPLLLTILAIIGRRQELPRDRHEVYAHAAAVLVEQWDINRHLRDVNVVIDYIDSEDRRELLRRVAARMQNGRKGLAGNHIRGADLVNEFASYLRSQYQLEVPAARQAARVMLAQFWERNFILSRYGADVYGFVHHAFLEYFSAQEIVQRFHAREIDPDYLRSRVFGEHWADEAWQEVLLLVAGILGDRFSRQIVDYLAKEANPFGMETAVFSPRNLVLAVRCFVEVRNLAAAELQGRKILESLIETLEYSAGRSASEVDRMIEEEILPLIQVVGSRWPGRARYRDWFVVLGGSIAWWPTSKLIGGIFVSLFTDEPDTRRRFFAATSSVLDYRLRRAAVEVVASNWREDPETPGWLRARAVEDPDGFVRQAAVEAVASGWREDPETPGWLRVRAVQDEHRFVRQAAVRAVAVRAVASGSQGDPETLGWLRVRAVEDPHGFVRQAAVEAVASGWREDPETLGWVRARAVHDPDEDVRQAAVRAVASGWHEDPETPGWLRVRAVQDEHRFVRQAAVEAVASGWREDPETPGWLRVRAVQDEHRFVRQAAVRAVAVRAVASGSQGDPETLGWLRARAVEDPHAFVRQAAVEAVASGWREDPETPGWLRVRAVHDEHRFVRQAAVEAVASNWREDPETPGWLRVRAVEDPDGSVRQAAVEAVASNWREDPETLGWLRVRAVHDEHRFVRQAAVRAVVSGWRENPVMVGWVRARAVHDAHWSVRQAAVEAVVSGWREDPVMVGWLRARAVQDAHWSVRQAAVRAVVSGWREDLATPGWLRARAVHDPHWSVRQVAVRAVVSGWREDPVMVGWVQARAVHDPHWSVRQAAVRAVVSGWSTDPATLGWLRVRAVEDPDGFVRQAAVEAVASGWREDPETLGWVRARAVHDPDEDVRQAALEAVVSGWGADPGTVGWLRARAVHDAHWSVRQAAVRAVVSGWREDLATVGWVRARAVHDPDEDVRQVAVRAVVSGWREDPATVGWLRARAVEDPDVDVRRAAEAGARRGVTHGS